MCVCVFVCVCVRTCVCDDSKSIIAQIVCENNSDKFENGH